VAVHQCINVAVWQCGRQWQAVAVAQKVAVAQVTVAQVTVAQVTVTQMTVAQVAVAVA
jgi:hypothetical protein